MVKLLNFCYKPLKMADLSAGNFILFDKTVTTPETRMDV